MRRKRHEPLPLEALDEPFGPPPEEYLLTFPLCCFDQIACCFPRNTS